MPRKKPMPSDEEINVRLKEKLWELLCDPPKREYRFSVPCKHSPAAGSGKELKHQVNVWVEDKASTVKIIQELWDRLEGKAATKREPPKPKVVGGNLDELSDQELLALLQEDSSGKTDGGAAEEAA